MIKQYYARIRNFNIIHLISIIFAALVIILGLIMGGGAGCSGGGGGTSTGSSDVPLGSNEALAGGDEAVTIVGNSSTLSIPAKAFYQPVNITLTASESTLDPALGVKAISLQINIAASEAAISQDPAGMNLVVNLKTGLLAEARANQNSVYFMVESSGCPMFDDTDSYSLSPVIGELDETAETLSLNLKALCTSASVVAVSGSSSSLQVILFGDDESEATLTPVGAQKAKQTFVKKDISDDPVITPLAYNRWAIVCSGGSLGVNVSFPFCNSSSPLPRQMLEIFRESADKLVEIGFRRALLQVTTVANLRRSLTPLLATDYAESEEDEDVYVVYIEGGVGAAAYIPEWGKIVMNPTEVTIWMINSRDDNLFAHELVHAVEAANTPNMWPGGWISEGVATAFDDMIWPNSSGTRERDWREPLSVKDPIISKYATSHFFRGIDATLSYLPRLYSQIGRQEVEWENSYRIIDQAFQSAIPEKSLGSLYLDFIPSVMPTATLINRISIGPEEQDTRIVSDELAPISAYIYRVVGGGEDYCLECDLKSPGTFGALPKQRLVMREPSGTIQVQSPTEPPLKFGGSGVVNLAIVDIDITRNEGNKEPGVLEVKYKLKCGRCGDGNVDVEGCLSCREGEECDDGNTVSGDGCSATCQIEDEEGEEGGGAGSAEIPQVISDQCIENYKQRYCTQSNYCFIQAYCVECQDGCPPALDRYSCLEQCARNTSPDEAWCVSYCNQNARLYCEMQGYIEFAQWNGVFYQGAYTSACISYYSGYDSTYCHFLDQTAYCEQLAQGYASAFSN